MLFCAYLLKNALALFLQSYFWLRADSHGITPPPKKLPDEPPSSQETGIGGVGGGGRGGGGGRNRHREKEKALIISP